MKDKSLQIKFAIMFILICSSVFSQEPIVLTLTQKKLTDSLLVNGAHLKSFKERPDIKLSKEQSLKYLQVKYPVRNWKNQQDPLRLAIGQLLAFANSKPFDSTRFFLESYTYDSINPPWEKFFVWDTIKISEHHLPADSVVLARIKKDLTIVNDSLILLAVDTLDNVTSETGSLPFSNYSSPFESDSVKAAINSLIRYIDEKDSLLVKISGSTGTPLPVWLNSKSEKLSRFWLKNENSDSVTVWIGGVSKNMLGLFLEDGVSFRRLTKESKYSDAHLNLKEINSKSLMELNPNAIKPHYWKLHSESNFILNQTSVSNWVKGGENSIALASDITGFADYNNKKINLLSNNFMRLKFGLVKSGDYPIRKNMDLLETNSKLNHRAFRKVDFSAIMLFKSQLANGYNYPNDSVPVSKFFNPATLTIGLGLDYKPNKTTSINFSPFSYKGTFVTDTLHIDQTRYGVPVNKKSLNEPGISLLIAHEFRPYKTITITNRLQLFTNYIHNPQNIDVDWEMIATAKINWFSEIRLNTHLIFDDDTKTVVLDEDKKPVQMPDDHKKRLQGFSLRNLSDFHS
jgi:hypothetical protein